MGIIWSVEYLPYVCIIIIFCFASQIIERGKCTPASCLLDRLAYYLKKTVSQI